MRRHTASSITDDQLTALYDQLHTARREITTALVDLRVMDDELDRVRAELNTARAERDRARDLAVRAGAFETPDLMIARGFVTSQPGPQDAA